jgi:excisionase family DNA binding protein
VISPGEGLARGSRTIGTATQHWGRPAGRLNPNAVNPIKRKPKKRHRAGAAKNAPTLPREERSPRGVLGPDGKVFVGALQTVDAAKYMGISLPTFRRLRKRGLIRGNRLTRHWLYPIAELDRALMEGLIE